MMARFKAEKGPIRRLMREKGERQATRSLLRKRSAQRNEGEEVKEIDEPPVSSPLKKKGERPPLPVTCSATKKPGSCDRNREVKGDEISVQHLSFGVSGKRNRYDFVV